MTPAGTPARLARSTSANAENGVSSAGFPTMAQPAPSAAPTLRANMAQGKFQGVIAAVTPIACWRKEVPRGTMDEVSSSRRLWTRHRQLLVMSLESNVQLGSPLGADRMIRLRVPGIAVCASCFLIFCIFCDPFPAFGQERIVTVSGWSDYIDPDVINDFTKETGIRVTYDPYDSNDALEGQLTLGKPAFDVVIVSGRPLQMQIAAGLYLSLDKSKLPNARYLWPEVMAHLAAYDPGNQYAVNYMWFTMGIAYDVEKTKKILGDGKVDASRLNSAARFSVPSFNSWGILFKPEYLKKLMNCGVGVLDSPQDLLAIARQFLWADWRFAPGLTRQNDLKRAADLLSGISRNAKKLNSSKYPGSLAKGEICLAVGYSVDSFLARDQAREVNNGIEINYALPEEGAPIMLDNLAIPKEASHVEEAYAFIDFLLRPDIAARNTNFTHMANGVLASKNLIDKSISDNKSIYPDTAVMQRLFVPKEHDLATQNAIILAPSRTKTGRQTR